MKDLDKTKENIEEQKLTIKKFEDMLAIQKREAAKIDDQTKVLNEKQQQTKSTLITIDHHVKQKKIEEDLISIMDIIQKKLKMEKIRRESKKKEEIQRNDVENGY